jgi:hypothetical protein
LSLNETIKYLKKLKWRISRHLRKATEWRR